MYQLLSLLLVDVQLWALGAGYKVKNVVVFEQNHWVLEKIYRQKTWTTKNKMHSTRGGIRGQTWDWESDMDMDLGE